MKASLAVIALAVHDTSPNACQKTALQVGSLVNRRTGIARGKRQNQRPRTMYYIYVYIFVYMYISPLSLSQNLKGANDTSSEEVHSLLPRQLGAEHPWHPP